LTLSLNSNTLYFLAFSLSLSDDGFVGASCGTSTFGLTGASTCMATRAVRSESTVREALAGVTSGMSARAGTTSADAGPSSPQSTTTSGKQALMAGLLCTVSLQWRSRMFFSTFSFVGCSEGVSV
jgi:hypothetical protein